jgi:predicted NBD/HSP70 family sugar kinase
VPAERMEGLAAVLGAIREDPGTTQPQLVDRVRLGRSVVAQRVAELEAAGLVEGDGHGPSTGGRAPRRLRVRAAGGLVLGVDVATAELVVGLADMAGAVLASRQEVIEVADGPEVVLAVAERLADELLAEHAGRGRLRAVGVGLPGPVEFRTGLPVAPPIMPGWDRYPVRSRLADRFGVPVWVDNDVNLLALAERRADATAAAASHMVYVRAGAGVGAGIVMGGELYRGANGSAGDIGHVAVPEGGDAICRCGNAGCLEAVAGAAAVTREGRLLAQTGQSPALAGVLQRTGELRAVDVTRAGLEGDPAARAVVQRTARVLGSNLAALVSFYNPDLLVVGGGIARASAIVLPALEEALRRRAHPLATQDLTIAISAVPEEVAGVSGAVQLALGEVFSAENLARWLAPAEAAADVGAPADAARDGLDLSA